MKYNLKYTSHFNRDLVKLERALKEHPNMSRRIFQEIERKIKGLKDNPFAYPVFYESKYRRVNLEGHAMFYTVDEVKREVRLYHLYYAKMDIEKRLGLK
jgi:plasmid stabilization system protein ParE